MQRERGTRYPQRGPDHRTVPAMIKFLLLRFLPRRIMPLLLLFEAYQLVQRLRRRDEPAPTPVSYGLAPTTTGDQPR